ncbi:hypothetical protein J3R30DRAFT_3287099 [Lentinula aciculospora]|uniref:F-box domain-containing protein n=1 Tax=Lentinula aciculospora TaxID=153920 RepID=A0A9W9AGX4_9AGAR|nr:hypothetical protein J3R30DRAFT_3287099 [Lentinula aciculospora]
MELSLEAYRIIVNNVRSRVDLAMLCLVSKGFRRVAERALYNTIFMHEAERTKKICKTLVSQPRVAELVEALTIAIEEDEGRGEDEGIQAQKNLWPAIADALKKMTRLRHLSVVIDGSLTSPYSGRLAWILADCPFRLKSFHSDMRWDEDLVRFLNVQDAIEDLYIGDYDEGQETEVVEMSGDPRTPNSGLILSPSALPHLFTLECTFSEAAIAIVPGRPVSRLKTCFSRTDPEGKREEMKILFEALGKALVIGRSNGWYALDIADAEYEENFAMDLLKAVVNLTLVRPSRTVASTTLTGSVSLKGTLRYLGTLVLPVGGKERLLFYGLLMQLRRLCCVELEVSAWNPSPATVGPVAFRALGNELRLYCPGMAKIVFVSMNVEEGDDIGERTTVEWVQGDGVARVEREVMNGMSGSEGLWRDV